MKALSPDELDLAMASFNKMPLGSAFGTDSFDLASASVLPGKSGSVRAGYLGKARGAGARAREAGKGSR